MIFELLPKAIVKLRQAKHLSQSAAADRAGVAASTWCLWENGDQTPRPEGVEKICKGLGCTLFDLEIKINQLHTEDLTQTAAKLGAIPPIHKTSELIAKAERLMKLDMTTLPEDLRRPVKRIRDFGVVLSTQYKPLIDSILEIHRRLEDPAGAAKA
ncbi:MAG: helix-turn-helix transcriptional regulator [bacterium]|nr:helix-turn-helix transcriptional regulator [bacterium]